MNESIPSFDDRPFKERVELRVVFHKVVDIFETCGKLKEVDKEMLLQEVSNRLKQHMPPQAPTEPSPPVEPPPPTSFADRCLELAAAAPNDKIWKALITIAQICDAEDALADDRA